MQVLLFLILLYLPFPAGVGQGIWAEFYLGSFQETLKLASLRAQVSGVAPPYWGALPYPRISALEPPGVAA